MTVRYKPRVNSKVSRQEYVNPAALRAGFVYVIQPGKPGYLALQDTAGAIYTAQEDGSLNGAKIISLNDNRLLLLLQNKIIENIRERVFQSGHKGLEQLFTACVKHLRIEQAALDGSVDITMMA